MPILHAQTLTWPQQPELTDPKARRLLYAPPTKRIVPSSTSESRYPEIDGAIFFPSAKPAPNDVEEYRDIAPGSAGPSGYSESSSGETTDEEDSDAVTIDSRQASLKALEEQLISDPTSIPTWLTLLSNTLSTVPIYSKNAPRVRAEISLAVLTRALSAHSANRKSVLLRLKLLSVGEELWSNEKLYEEWEDALTIESVELWMRWLDWRIRLPHVSIDMVISDAERVLSVLDADEVSKLRVQWRIAVAFRDAGEHF